MFCTFLFLLVVATSTGYSDFDAKLARRNLYALGHANNYFALDLHKKLAQETGGNVIFSPFSVSSVLAMLYRGAREQTAAELRKVLCYEKLNDSALFSSYSYYLTDVIGKINPKLYTIHSVSTMVVDKSFPVLQQYKEDMQNIFQAYVQEADIADENAAIVDRVNTWAKIKTKGVISKLANRLEPDTRLFLASAAYFKGAWKLKFDPEETKSHPFYNGGIKANAREVPMMHSYATHRYYEEEGEGFTAIELLYEGRNMSMVIYLPTEDNGLWDLEEGMTPDALSMVRRQMYFMKVHLTLPRFELHYDRSLARALQELGVVRVFHGSQAELSGMTDREASLALNDVKHKASIVVNEQGSVATAVTRAIVTKSLSRPARDPVFNVNHPFLFAIFDCQTGLILFMGRVTDL